MSVLTSFSNKHSDANVKISTQTKYFLNENVDIWRKTEKIMRV